MTAPDWEWVDEDDEREWVADLADRFEAVMSADRPVAAGPRLAPTPEVLRPLAVVRAAYMCREVLAHTGHDDPALIGAWVSTRRLIMAPGVLTPAGQAAVVALMPACGPASPRVARIELVAVYRTLDGLVAVFSQVAGA